MKEFTITSVIHSCTPEELSAADQELLKEAIAATGRSYAPYSRFSVGAAARLGNGVIITGTNQENAAYPSGLCAERTTLFYANSQYPDQPVEVLAVAARTEQDFIDIPIPPCGSCRQVILETEKRYKKSVRILLYGKKETYMMEGISSLLLLSFNASAVE
ncbi:MAG: cytidine deaminase [Bacteroides sp.]|nr:cytidine deaminase [Bacteroides sp.]